MRDGEERHMFDIRVVFRRVCDDVMNIVIPFPPSQTQTSQVISNHHANHTVDMELMRDAHVSCIMSTKDKLMPKATKPKSRRPVPSQAEEEIGKSCKKGIPAAFNEVREVIAVVKSLVKNLLVQFTVFYPDKLLVSQIKGRVFSHVGSNCLLSYPIEEEWLFRLGFIIAFGI